MLCWTIRKNHKHSNGEIFTMRAILRIEGDLCSYSQVDICTVWSKLRSQHERLGMVGKHFDGADDVVLRSSEGTEDLGALPLGMGAFRYRTTGAT